MARSDRQCPGCQSCQHRLAGLSIFSGLSEEGVKRLDDSRLGRNFEAGRSLFREGESPTGLWCLARGLVKVYRYDSEGRIHFLRWARPGDPIGYRALLSGEPHRTTATAVTDCHVCHLSGGVFQSLLDQESDLGRAVIKKLSKDLAVAEQGWVEASGLTSTQRVAALLLDWDNIPHEKLSRKDLAEVAGVTPETFSRVVATFHKQKLVKRQPRRLTVLNREGLAALLNACSTE